MGLGLGVRVRRGAALVLTGQLEAIGEDRRRHGGVVGGLDGRREAEGVRRILGGAAHAHVPLVRPHGRRVAARVAADEPQLPRRPRDAAEARGDLQKATGERETRAGGSR